MSNKEESKSSPLLAKRQSELLAKATVDLVFLIRKMPGGKELIKAKMEELRKEGRS